MSRSTVRAARLSSRATILAALFAGVLVLGGLLASEAWRAARSGAATARRALASHAAVAAWEFLRGVEQEMDVSAGDALAPVIAARAATPFDSLPGPRVLAASFPRELACPSEGSTQRLVRVDLRDGALTLHGAPMAREDVRWIVDTLRSHASRYAPGRRAAIIIGDGAREHLALVYGVKFAGFGAPLAAYALVTCPAAFGAPVFERVLSRRTLLPDAVLIGQPNDSLVALTVRDRHGHRLWRNATVDIDATPFTARASLPRLGNLTVEATLRPAAVARLALEPLPRMRLGAIVALLVLTTGLAGVALVQLRREQELVRLRADFTSSVSHELRTPLAQIMLFGETLALDRYRTQAERHLAADTIVQEATRLMHMVDNVLHFARAERGLVGVSPRAEPLAPLARAAIAAFAPLADGVRFAEEMEEDVVALVDAGALRQVLLNLLDNAVKYGPPAQVVTVGVSRAGDRARLWVDDEGAGVPPEQRDRIWAPYVRMKRHQGAARGGSGIGLAVVRELAEVHDGAVWVEASPAGGARFILELPLADAGGPPQHHHASAAASDRHRERASITVPSPALASSRAPRPRGGPDEPASLPGDPA